MGQNKEDGTSAGHAERSQQHRTSPELVGEATEKEECRQHTESKDREEDGDDDGGKAIVLLPEHIKRGRQGRAEHPYHEDSG